MPSTLVEIRDSDIEVMKEMISLYLSGWYGDLEWKRFNDEYADDAGRDIVDQLLAYLRKDPSVRIPESEE